MPERLPSHLRIHRESFADSKELEIGDTVWIERLCRQFQSAAAWPLTWFSSEQASLFADPLWSAPVNPGVGIPPGYLGIGKGAGNLQRGQTRCELEAATALAGSLGELLNELRAAQRSLWEREAELAAGVPVISRPDEADHLATRLTATLRAGAESAGCQAAGLYLLDADTTELKLRAGWNLPAARLTAPARVLRGSVADLEALAGSAVVLEDDLLHSYWKVPEDYPAAVCLPLSTPSTILGTVWFFADEPRGFTDQQTNQLEIITGRLAGDLEREMLLADTASTRELKRDVSRAERLQSSQSLTRLPEVEGWKLAGWSQQGEALGGAFYDAWTTPAEQGMFTVGTALDGGAAAALVAASTRSALRAHGESITEPAQLLARANRTLWTSSAGDQFASVLVGQLAPRLGQIRIGAAGEFCILIVDEEGTCRWHSLHGVPLALAEMPQCSAEQWELLPGSTLVAWTGWQGDPLRGARTTWEAAVCEEMVAAHRHRSIHDLADLLHDLTAAQEADSHRLDQALFIARRD